MVYIQSSTVRAHPNTPELEGPVLAMSSGLSSFSYTRWLPIVQQVRDNPGLPVVVRHRLTILTGRLVSSSPGAILVELILR